jgi:hypothetical protein
MERLVDTDGTVVMDSSTWQVTPPSGHSRQALSWSCALRDARRASFDTGGVKRVLCALVR